MIKVELLHEFIKDSLYDVKSSLTNRKVKFARLEQNSSNKKNQQLLSIVLDNYYGKEEIDEIVIDFNVAFQGEELIVNADLSLGNGFILKEESIRTNINNGTQNELTTQLKDLFLKNIVCEIDGAINSLDRS